MDNLDKKLPLTIILIEPLNICLIFVNQIKLLVVFAFGIFLMTHIDCFIFVNDYTFGGLRGKKLRLSLGGKK